LFPENFNFFDLIGLGLDERPAIRTRLPQTAKFVGYARKWTLFLAREARIETLAVLVYMDAE
jgi:hypothetical protein